MNYKLVAFGPSLVDINIKLKDEVFQEVCNLYDIDKGDWRGLTFLDEMTRILKTIGLNDVVHSFSGNSNEDFRMVPGSSTLSMLAVQKPALRYETLYISSLATTNGILTPLSSFFHNEVSSLGINHAYSPIEGNNPVGLVLSSYSQPDKILFFYPGVSKLFNSICLPDISCDLILIDCYELQNGELSSYLDSIILSSQYRIGLSLGNHTILQGDLLEKVRNYIFNNKIFILTGNQKEYQCLFPELPIDFTTKEGFKNHFIKKFVKYALITLGSEGMIAYWGESIFSVDADFVDVTKVTSTSGAGDVAAGVFCGGVIQNDDCLGTITKAAKLSSKVIQVASSMIIGQ